MQKRHFSHFLLLATGGAFAPSRAFVPVTGRRRVGIYSPPASRSCFGDAHKRSSSCSSSSSSPSITATASTAFTASTVATSSLLRSTTSRSHVFSPPSFSSSSSACHPALALNVARRRRPFGTSALHASGDGGAGDYSDGSRRDEDSSGDGDGDRGREGKDPDELNPLLYKVKQWWADEETQEDIKSYSVSLGLALLVRFFIVEPRYIPSLSMYPTFDIGDQLAVEKVSKIVRRYARNDVVVFRPPPAFMEVSGQSSYKKEALIKRVIAVAGDKVEVKNGGTLYVNDVPQKEPFTYEKAFYDFGPVTVPTGCLMVFGDNRNHSLDSHIWGFLPSENVIGRAIFKYWPVWRAGGIESSAIDL